MQDKRDADGPDRHVKAQSKSDRDPRGLDAEDLEAETDGSAVKCAASAVDHVHVLSGIQ